MAAALHIPPLALRVAVDTRAITPAQLGLLSVPGERRVRLAAVGARTSSLSFRGELKRAGWTREDVSRRLHTGSRPERGNA